MRSSDTDDCLFDGRADHLLGIFDRRTNRANSLLEIYDHALAHAARLSGCVSEIAQTGVGGFADERACFATSEVDCSEQVELQFTHVPSICFRMTDCR